MEHVTYNSHLDIRGPRGTILHVRKRLWEAMEERVRKHNNRRAPLERETTVTDILNEALAVGLLGQEAARQMRAELAAAADREAATRRAIADREAETAADMERRRARGAFEIEAKWLLKAVRRGPSPSVQRVVRYLRTAEAAGVDVDAALKAAGIDREAAGNARFIEAALRVYDRENEPVGA